MSVVEFNNVWKKFKRGEKIYSFRDAIPAMFGNVIRRIRNGNQLDAQEFWALKDVSFEVKKGEVVGIIGPNGAGKSTILKLLSRIFVPNKGTFRVDGRLSALIEITAGFHPDFTGRENVYFNGAMLGMSKREIDAKFDSIVAFSEIEEFIDTPVKRYSSGMSARLGFSIAAHVDPDVLLVDEVLAVGDMAFQAKCAQKMRELLNSGTTIVLVAHNLPMIQSLCKRAILLNHGEIQKEGSPNEVIPYYENTVYKKREDDLKRELDLKGRIHLEHPTSVNISSLFLHNGKDGPAERFKTGEPISITVEYEAKEKIDNPVFSLDIIRADGVVCCSSNTKYDNADIRNIQGKGKIAIDLGRINLAPGLYVIKVAILDKDMLYPYAIRKNDVFRIENDNAAKNRDGIFLADIKWEQIKP